jgi:hypothetical protein
MEVSRARDHERPLGVFFMYLSLLINVLNDRIPSIAACIRNTRGPLRAAILVMKFTLMAKQYGVRGSP